MGLAVDSGCGLWVRMRRDGQQRSRRVRLLGWRWRRRRDAAGELKGTEGVGEG